MKNDCTKTSFYLDLEKRKKKEVSNPLRGSCQRTGCPKNSMNNMKHYPPVPEDCIEAPHKHVSVRYHLNLNFVPTHRTRKRAEEETRGPRTLALCLTAAVRMTLAIFCRFVSKTHCCRLNQLKSGLTLTKYITVSILDQIRHLNFDFSGSLKVKCDSVTGLHIWVPIWVPINV